MWVIGSYKSQCTQNWKTKGLLNYICRLQLRDWLIKNWVWLVTWRSWFLLYDWSFPLYMCVLVVQIGWHYYNFAWKRCELIDLKSYLVSLSSQIVPPPNFLFRPFPFISQSWASYIIYILIIFLSLFFFIFPSSLTHLSKVVALCKLYISLYSMC